MLTRKTAIERLRKTGTLATTPKPATALTKKPASDPLAIELARIVSHSRTSPAERWLAPSANHSILP